MNATVYESDLVIVGAGIAGAALAWALRDSGLAVTLIEAASQSPLLPPLDDSVQGFDPRVSALTSGSVAWLDTIGVWSAIADRRPAPFRAMHVWDADGTGAIDFQAVDVNQSALGYIVENRELVAALHQQISTSRHCRLLHSANLTGLQRRADQFVLTLADGRELLAGLVIGADGVNSRVRQLCDFTTREWDYHHHAIVATIATADTHRDTAWQRFMTEGPLAVLPLGESSNSAHQQSWLSSIVWSTIPEHAEQLMALSDADFNAELSRSMEYRLGNVLASSTRYRFPLRQRHAVDYVQPGVALVGDAAHSIHPLAGQGINLGLADVAVLTEELQRACSRGIKAGDLSVLKRYQRRRKSDNLLMMLAMDGFKRLFEQPKLPVRWLRNTGMSWLDRQAVLKNAIIRQAMLRH